MVWMYFSVTAACVHGGQMPLWYIKDNQIQGLRLDLIKYNSKKMHHSILQSEISAAVYLKDEPSTFNLRVVPT